MDVSWKENVEVVFVRGKKIKEPGVGENRVALGGGRACEDQIFTLEMLTRKQLARYKGKCS